MKVFMFAVSSWLAAATLVHAAAGDPRLLDAVKSGTSSRRDAVEAARRRQRTASGRRNNALHWAAHFDDAPMADLLIMRARASMLVNTRARRRFISRASTAARQWSSGC